jgi:hypothetical protein
MSRRKQNDAHQGSRSFSEPDPALRELLDHVARQLAEEYVRLLRQYEIPDYDQHGGVAR